MTWPSTASLPTAAFPSPPSGVGRFEHLPTIEAAIRYWSLVRDQAIGADEIERERTAAALVASYEGAREVLMRGPLAHAAG